MLQEPTMDIRNQVDASLEDWRQQEKTALELLRITGELRFNKSIDLILFRREIYDSRPSTVLNTHRFAHNYSTFELPVATTLQVAKTIHDMEGLAPCRVDIGHLGLEWIEGGKKEPIHEFVDSKLGQWVGAPSKNDEHRDIVLYGFGRIGRLAARRIISMTAKGEQLRLKAIVIRPKMKDQYQEALKRANLLESDSVHGDFAGKIDVSEDGTELIINGNRIKLIYAKQPEDIDYTDYGIKDALVIDNTGVWRDGEALKVHMRPGVSKVLLTAPAKGDVPNIVYGVNHEEYDGDDRDIFSAASCTTNAIVPALKVINDTLGIDKGHVETIHAYTNDQNLIDNFHKKPRRGRGAPLNMVLTTTGAASAVSKVLPELDGILTGNAIRIPTPNVSMAILNLTLKKGTTAEELNNIIQEAALHGDLVEQIHYSSDPEYVSTNVVGMPSACVIDAPSTIVSKDGKNVVVYCWYDNEYGYTCQVVRLAKHLTKVRRYCYY